MNSEPSIFYDLTLFPTLKIMASAFIKSLPNEAKVWFAKAVAGIIVADHKINEAELYYLQGTIMFLGDEEEVKKIISLVKKKEKPNLAFLKTDRKTATRIFIELATLAVTDDKLSQSEADFFIHVGGKLGFDTFFSRRVLGYQLKPGQIGADPVI